MMPKPLKRKLAVFLLLPLFLEQVPVLGFAASASLPEGRGLLLCQAITPDLRRPGSLIAGDDIQEAVAETAESLASRGIAAAVRSGTPLRGKVPIARVEDLIKRYPRLGVDLSGDRDPDRIPLLLKLYLNSKHRNPGFTLPRLQNVLDQIADAEAALKAVLPELKPFDAIRVIADDESSIFAGCARYPTGREFSIYQNAGFNVGHHLNPLWAFLARHEIGELVLGDHGPLLSSVQQRSPEDRRSFAMNTQMRSILQGYPLHEFVRVEAFPKSIRELTEAGNGDLRDFFFAYPETPADVVADAIALRLDAGRTDVLEGAQLLRDMDIEAIRRQHESIRHYNEGKFISWHYKNLSTLARLRARDKYIASHFRASRVSVDEDDQLVLEILEPLTNSPEQKAFVEAFNMVSHYYEALFESLTFVRPPVPGNEGHSLEQNRGPAGLLSHAS